MSFEIKGEAGKPLDEALRPLSDFGNDAILEYENAAVDRFTLRVETASAAVPDAPLPEPGQALEVWQDGVRVFAGVVVAMPTEVSPEAVNVTIEAAGVGWWLEHTPLSEIVEDGGGNDRERVQFYAPKGDAKAHFERLINRAAAIGLPVALGSVADCYDIPTVTLADMSFLSALQELLKRVPDAVVWWDYSVAGDPEFHLVRRDPAATTDFTVGQEPLIGARISPAVQLKVDEVTVTYAERDLNNIILSSQSAGVGPRRQVVTVSGPEIADFVPPDPRQRWTIFTREARPPLPSSGNWMNNLEDLWGFPNEVAQRHNPGPGVAPTLRAWDSDDGPGTDSARYSGGAEPSYYDQNGNAMNSASVWRWGLFPSDVSIPQFVKDLGGVQTGRLVGTVFYTWSQNPGIAQSVKDFYEDLRAGADFVSQLLNTTTGATQYWAFYDLDFELDFFPSSQSGTQYDQPPAWIFEEPPAGFVTGLQAAQSWLPYEGDVQLYNEPFVRRLGQDLNISAGLPAWATMAAPVQAERMELATGLQTLRIGASPRSLGADVVTRLPANPRDNVVIL